MPALPKNQRFWDNPVKRKRTGNRKTVPRTFLPLDEFEYFTKVEKLMDENNFDCAEDKTLFIDNVFKSIDGKELKLVTDRAGSRVCEKLLAIANDFQIRVFFGRLAESYKDLCVDKFASHVLQTLLRLSLPILQREVVNGVNNPDEAKDYYSMQKIINFFLEELSEDWLSLAYDPYGSHVLRVLLGLLCGQFVDERLVRSKSSIGFTEAKKTALKCSSVAYKVPPEFKGLYEDLVIRIVDTCDLVDFSTHSIACHVVQALLILSKKHSYKQHAAIIQKLLRIGTTEAVDAEHIRTTFIFHHLGSRTMETVFSTVSHTTYRSLYLNVFRNHLLEYSLHPVGNYVVQHFMRNLEDSVLKEQVVGELVNTIEDILAVGHFGVVDALTAVTIGLSEIYQKKVVNSLLKAFHLQESSKFKYTVPCVLRLLTFEMYSSEDGSTETTTYFGASILMNAFKLQQNAVEPLIQSLLTMEPDEILALCKDPHGSFVMEAFLTSRIDLPRKKKIYKRVKNQLARLAMDKYGSRVLEAIWASADIAFKEFIADSLLGEEQQISSNMYGKIVMKKCNIDFYKRKKTAWLEKQEANQKKQELFKDILEETPDSSDSKLVQNKRKRAETPLADEIDKLFTSKRKTRNSAVSQRSTSQNPKIKEEDLALREELSSVDPFALDMKLTIKNIKKKNKKLKREKPSKKFIMS